MLNPPSLIIPPLSKNTRDGYMKEGGGKEGKGNEGGKGKKERRMGREDTPSMVRKVTVP